MCISPHHVDYQTRSVFAAGIKPCDAFDCNILSTGRGDLDDVQSVPTTCLLGICIAAPQTTASAARYANIPVGMPKGFNCTKDADCQSGLVCTNNVLVGCTSRSAQKLSPVCLPVCHSLLTVH
jgi:hypothetical protein